MCSGTIQVRVTIEWAWIHVFITSYITVQSSSQPPSQNYTANDYETLFSDIRYPQGYTQFKSIQDINVEWPAPNMSTFCFYGVGLKTDEKFVYDDQGFPNGIPVHLIKGDGDRTVNLPSSEVCLYVGQTAVIHSMGQHLKALKIWL